MVVQKIALVAVAGILLSGCSLLDTKQAEVESGESMDVQVPQEESMEVKETMMQEDMPVYTLAEVAEHATKTDCWVIVEGGVYNVTDFVMAGKHPGGDISSQCGTDITEMFFERPNDKGPHPENAQGFLQTMKVGVVQTEQ